MPPLDKKQTQELPEYDAFFIGGGSGGLASAVCTLTNSLIRVLSADLVTSMTLSDEQVATVLK
jgi:hypothetical protein